MAQMTEHLYGGNANSSVQDIPRIDEVQAHAGKVMHIAGNQAQVVL